MIERIRVVAVGKAIEAETRAEIAEKRSIEKPVDHIIVGINGAFVEATRSKVAQKFNRARPIEAAATGRNFAAAAISMISRARRFVPLLQRRTWARHQAHRFL